MIRSTELVQWFRQSTPYVTAHRDKTFVIMLDGNTTSSPNFSNIIDDISLLHSLGIKLVIVFGARKQINDALAEAHIAERYHKNIRVTDPQTLHLVKQVVGSLQFDITARLSLRMNNITHNGVPNVVSGNFVIAQPLGVDDGVDYQLSGKVRKIDSEGIKQQLERNAIVVISPIGVSVTGETFNLAFEELAAQIAIKLKAEKVIGFCEKQGIIDENQQVIADLTLLSAEEHLRQFIAKDAYHSSEARFLQTALEACRNGVKRAHLLSYLEDGSLLQELFSRDGIGTQISLESSEIVRIANIKDIPSLLALIHPLEQQGILVKRSREQLEMEIDHYTIIDRDGVIIAIDDNKNMAKVEITSQEAPKNPEKMKETFIKQIEKMGDSDFYARKVRVLSDLPFLPISVINELRRELLDKLMQERISNYKREYQKPLEHTLFPKEKLDYHANIHNQTAKEFYEKCGCEVCEMSLESGKCKSKSLELMKTKHCLKYAFDMCGSKENLFLVDEKGKKYPLEFDCKNCEMIIHN